MAQARRQFRMMDGPPAKDVVERVIGEVRASTTVDCSVIEIRDHVATVEISGPAADVERVYNYGSMARLW